MNQIKKSESNILIFVFAGSALIYEMILGSTLVLLFGDSIYYFSMTIAVFILFMGLGSSSIKWFKNNLFFNLILAELFISIAGASSPFAVQGIAGISKSGLLATLTALFFIAVIGFLAGLEIPLVFSLLKAEEEKERRFKFLLAFDYLGALVGAILFSFVLLPSFDLIGAATLTALLNLLLLFYFILKYRLSHLRSRLLWGLTSIFLLFAGALFLKCEYFQSRLDQNIFQISDRTTVVSAFRTKYQKVTVTLTPLEDVEKEYKSKVDDQLGGALGAPWISIYLNRYVQAFSPLASQTDFYHHAFVHPAMLLAKKHENILILGGGDGLPAKEVLKYPEVQFVTNIDLDGEWIHFTKTDPRMMAHSFNSLNNTKVQTVIEDAFHWVRLSKKKFDVILVDFPEGVDLPLARSYSLQFLKDLKRLIDDDGVISFQVDFFDNPAFWSIIKTMQTAGFQIIPHRTLEPGEDKYGFILLSKNRMSLDDYDLKIKKYSFVNPQLLLSAKILESYRNEDFLNSKSEGLMINTFFHPSFLYYYRTALPWNIFIGNND